MIMQQWKDFIIRSKAAFIIDLLLKVQRCLMKDKESKEARRAIFEYIESWYNRKKFTMLLNL